MTHRTGSTWVLTRWVARRTGVLGTLYLRVKTEGSVPCFGRGRAGYAAGTTGEALVTTHPVLADGRPDLGVTLATDRFNPCARAGLAESAAIRLDLPVVAGGEYATIVRNVDLSPGTNWPRISRRPVDHGSGLIPTASRTSSARTPCSSIRKTSW